LNQIDFKVACFTVNVFDLRQGEQFDIDVPADLDQFRRNDSHGTVVGGECFVQLGHHAPDRTRFLYQVDIVTGIGQIQGSLHPGDTAADHHHGT
jgi:hypothetical protein